MKQSYPPGKYYNILKKMEAFYFLSQQCYFLVQQKVHLSFESKAPLTSGFNIALLSKLHNIFH